MDATRSAINWLSSQMQDLKEKLTQSEAALHEFRKTNNIDSVSMEDKQTINAQTMQQLNQSLSNARAQGFCGTCGTPIYASDVKQPAMFNLRTGPLAERAQLKPMRQIWCRSALDWAQDLDGMELREKS